MSRQQGGGIGEEEEEEPSWPDVDRRTWLVAVVEAVPPLPRVADREERPRMAHLVKSSRQSEAVPIAHRDPCMARGGKHHG